MSLQSASICVLLCAECAWSDGGVCPSAAGVHISESCSAQPCVAMCFQPQLSCSEPMSVQCSHQDPGLGMCRAGKDEILLEHWLKQGRV